MTVCVLRAQLHTCISYNTPSLPWCQGLNEDMICIIHSGWLI